MSNDSFIKDVQNNIKYINNTPIKDDYLYIDKSNEKTKNILKNAKNKSNKYYNKSKNMLNNLINQNTDYFNNDTFEYEVSMGTSGSMIKYKYGTYINPIIYIKYKNNIHYQLLIDFNDKHYIKYPYLSVNKILFCCDYKYLGFLLELNGDDCNELFLFKLDKTKNLDLGYKFLLIPIINGVKTHKNFQNIHDICFIKNTDYMLFSSGSNFLISKNLHFFKISDLIENNKNDYTNLIYNIYNENTEYSIDFFYSVDYSSFYLVKGDHSRSIKYIIQHNKLNKLLNDIYAKNIYTKKIENINKNINENINENINKYYIDECSLKTYFIQLNDPLTDIFFNIDSIGSNYYILSNILDNNNHIFKLSYNDLSKFSEFVSNGTIKDYIYVKPHKQNALVDFYIHKNFIIINELNMNINKYYLIHKKNFNKKIIDLSSNSSSKFYSSLDKLNNDFKNYDISFITKYNTFNNDFVYLDIDNVINPTKFIKYYPLIDDYNLINEKTIYNFNSSDYIIENRNIQFNNNFKIPTTLFYHKDLSNDISKNFKNAKETPLFITGYGSYGSSFDIGFNKMYLNLLSKKIVIIILHIRGGSENGLNWYLDGKMENKNNTIDDFINGIKYYSKLFNTKNIAVRSRSAGGIIAGSVINIIPQYVKVVIPEVPFVDIVTTLADKSLPLSEYEYLEFGNPYLEKDFKNLMKISPYENIDLLVSKLKNKKLTKYDLPHVYIFAGLNDTRIRYDEPLKYYCKLLDNVYNNNKNKLFIDFNNFGHFGPSKPKEKIKFISKLQLVIINNLLK